MTFIPPNKILVQSDGNILELKQVVKLKNKEEVYAYKFIKSVTKMGMEFEMTEKFIVRQLTNFFKEIQ